MPSTPAQITVGELVARYLENAGLGAAFGVISIHNMPILDAIGKRGNMRFVAARGEAGALNMADAYARVSGGLGVAFTSTGTAAGNAAGAMVEAITAGSPVLHITGQIDAAHVGRDRAYIHEAPAQLEMLRAVSKSAYAIMTPDDALHVLRCATRDALTPPRGPVSIEIPIDVQKSLIDLPADIDPWPATHSGFAPTNIDALIDAIKKAKKPMLMFGGGARDATDEATRLAQRGFAVVTSTNGRAVVPEDADWSLGAFNVSPEIESLYAECDLLVVIGSRLRSNETWTYRLKLPDNLAVVDIDPRADGRVYPNRLFVQGEARAVLTTLLQRLPKALDTDARFLEKTRAAKQTMVSRMREGLGTYTTLVDSLQQSMPANSVWVRDVTVSNSTWGNRYLRIDAPRNGVHALGGGIGQGMPMSVGAATAAPDRKTVLLTGDGGFCLCLGELITAADEQSNITILMMNDSGYGVIRNIQDAEYGERHYFSNILIPDFGKLCESIGIRHWKVSKLDKAEDALREAMAVNGPTMVEIDMTTIGPYAHKFAGPPKAVAKQA
jgi:acetolactate synthase I/II/III large subunit